MDNFELKREHLLSAMQEYGKHELLVAFSGGVDSSLVLKSACEAAKKTGTTVYAVTVHTRLHPTGDLEAARIAAAEMGAVHKEIVLDELKEAAIGNNPTDRCYRCKKALFKRILKLAGKLGASTVLDGTNEDDLHVYRPGIRALKELGITSPLVDSGFTKAEVRRLALEYHLSSAVRPSAPCLATRFPYGTLLSLELMAKVEQAETYLKKLGFYNIRVRVHGDISRIEVDCCDFPKILNHKEEITAFMSELGFSYITLDLEGFRSGSMDIGLEEEQEHVGTVKGDK